MFRSIFTKSLRDYRWAILGWGIGLGLLVYFYYATILSQLAGTSSAQLQQIAGQFSFFGETVRADTPGGYITFKIMGSLPIVLGIWTVLAGARMTRGEEERGALDILLSTPQSRLGMVVEKVLALAAATALISVLMGVLILAGMASAKASLPDSVTVDPGAALLGAVNAGVAAAAGPVHGPRRGGWLGRRADGAQLCAGRHGQGNQRRVLAAAVLAALLLRSELAVGPRPRDELGRVQSARGPLRHSGGRRGAALPAARRGTLRAGGRDAWQVIAQAQREVWVRSIGLQALRRQGAAMFWWILVLAVFAGYLVVIAKTTEKQIADLISNNPTFQKIFSGADIGTNAGFLSVIVFAYVPIIVAIFGGIMAYRWPTDLDKGRLELPLSTPQSRWRVILERYSAVLGATVVATLSIWLAIVLFAQAAGFNMDVGRLAEASLGMLPLALITASLVYALAGLLPPSLVIGIMAAFLAASFLADLLRNLLNLPDWALNLSMFHQYGSPVLTGLNWGGFVGMLVVAAALLALGGWQFSARDIDRGVVES